jgi:Ni/Co efflux regulator RcnB
MTKNRIIGAIAALSLLAVPAVAAAHGSGDDHGRHDGRHHHHKHHGKKAKKNRDVTGSATGTIASFTAGELTITLPSGKSFTADVKRRTVIRCKSLPVVPAATTARHGDDDGPNHDRGDDHGNHGPSSTAPASTTTPSTTVPAPTTDNSDHNNGHGTRCGTDALVAGTSVATAKLSLQGGNATWKKVVLLK